MRMLYRIKAVGIGLGFCRYPLDFVVASNYDIDKDKTLVMIKVKGELKRTWGGSYEIKSVTKLLGGL